MLAGGLGWGEVLQIFGFRDRFDVERGARDVLGVYFGFLDALWWRENFRLVECLGMLLGGWEWSMGDVWFLGFA